jgi:hypothetical protein
LAAAQRYNSFMVREASKKVELNSKNLAAAVKQLIELAVEFEKFNDLSLEDVDADIEEDLFDVEQTTTALGAVVNMLLVHARRRATTVRSLRVARFIHQLRSVLPSKVQLPPDAAARVKAAGDACSLDLTAEQIDGVVEAFRRQGGTAEGPGFRAFTLLAGDVLGERTLESILALFDAPVAVDASNGAASSTPAGKIKYASQLHVGMYEGEGGTASLAYVLKAIGKGTPEAVDRAMAGWRDGLQAQLERGLEASGRRKDE